MHDSGERQVFATGAQRDIAEEKPRPDLRSPFAAERCGRWMALGAKKYSENNWMRGMPFSRVLASLCRHLMQYQQGDTTSGDDHLAAIVFNAEALIHYEAMIQRGVLPPELDDRPNYAPTLPACHEYPPTGDDSDLI